MPMGFGAEISSASSTAMIAAHRSAFAEDAAAQAARILLETNSVLFRPDDPFKLTSGRMSPVYTDCRRLISFPRARSRITELACELIQRAAGTEGLDVIAGGETAGIPFAAWIADRLALPMVYVRKQPKGFGRNAQIEGTFEEGARAILVEDLATDGGSKLNFVRALRDAGAEVAHCFVVFHYGIFPASTEHLAKEGVRLYGLTTWADVVEAAEPLGYFENAAQLAKVKAFLDDPDGWEP